jgi:hypothetical protein
MPACAGSGALEWAIDEGHPGQPERIAKVEVRAQPRRRTPTRQGHFGRPVTGRSVSSPQASRQVALSAHSTVHAPVHRTSQCERDQHSTRALSPMVKTQALSCSHLICAPVPAPSWHVLVCSQSAEQSAQQVSSQRLSEGQSSRHIDPGQSVG